MSVISMQALNADCNMNGILDICEPVPPVQLIGGAATESRDEWKLDVGCGPC